MTALIDTLRTLNTDRAANRDAILAFLAEERPGPDDHATCIELAHLAVAAAGYTDPVPADRVGYLRIAVDSARRALVLGPDQAASHYWFAVCRALQLDVEGPFAKVFGIKEVRKSAERSVELDESLIGGLSRMPRRRRGACGRERRHGAGRGRRR